ncbi:MAG TPA: metallophosphoesterase [Candidatus Dormibacteraeota bacterium]|nr:metallophosphoesterase [Candidatus Dormibacteraeota bacterium]
MQTAILGDIHGDYERMLGLVGDLPADVHLLVVGDYFDRWPHAMEAVRWLMARPNTTALLGNHDALILGVVAEVQRAADGGRSTESWLWNGGKKEDLDRLMADPEAIEWLKQRPAMTMVGSTLVQHCDSPVYINYGGSVDEVNRAFAVRVASGDPDVLFSVFAHLCRRRQFYKLDDLRQYLGVFGAAALVHGHTPHVQPAPLSLFNGTIVNVDGALSRGFGPEPRGFLYWLGDEPAADATLVR